jgi:DNA-binding transcriptional MerR regulator
LTELIEAAGGGQVTPRFVRFLIAEGVLDPPSGGRAHADYGEAHLRGVLNYIRLRDLGFSQPQIKELFRSQRGETVPVELAPGLTLHVNLARLDRTLSPDAIANRTRKVLADLLATVNAEGNHDADAE